MESPIDNCLPITRENFTNIDIDKPFETTGQLLEAQVAYSKAAQQAAESGDERTAKLYRSIGILCSFLPHFDNPKEPYTAAIIGDGRRAPIPSDLTELDLNVVAELHHKTS